MTLEACWRGLYRVNITYARYLYGGSYTVMSVFLVLYTDPSR